MREPVADGPFTPATDHDILNGSRYGFRVRLERRLERWRDEGVRGIRAGDKASAEVALP